MRPRRKDSAARRRSPVSVHIVTFVLLLSSVDAVKSQNVTPQPPKANVSSFMIFSDATDGIAATGSEMAAVEQPQAPKVRNDAPEPTASARSSADASPQATSISVSTFSNVPANTGMSALVPVGDVSGPPDVEPINESGKRRQYVPLGRAAFDAGFLNAPALPAGPGLPPPSPPGPTGPVGTCPSGGPSLPIECDPKRPWPQCPPQSYCYATNTVDIGPYFCCPIWSTYGAAWRPATPFYSYAPPPPPNWPEVFRYAADPRPFVPRKSRKESHGEHDNTLIDAPLNDTPTEDQLRIQESVNGWLERQPLTADEIQLTGGSTASNLN